MNRVGILEFTQMSSQDKQEFLLGDNPIVEMRRTGRDREDGESRLQREIKITPVERDGDAIGMYMIQLTGGFKKLMPETSSVIYANHAKIKDKTFRFEWVG